MTTRAAPKPDGPDGRAGLDAATVGALVADQFPQWAHLPVRPVPRDGWDNRTYRLGDGLSCRLPTGPGYVAAVEKEHRYLPRLAAGLPVPIPESVTLGEPGHGYPFPWSIRRWLPGVTALAARIDDHEALARDVAGFLRALQAIDAAGGPPAGAHNVHRGAPLAHYDDETRRAVDSLGDRIDGGRALRIWTEAAATEWSRDPVWLHGDVAAGNLLVEGGRLSAVIDFGGCGVGDPACDLAVAWTFFAGAGRQAFRVAIGLDEETWERGRAWALWKALVTLAWSDDAARLADSRRVLAGVLAGE